MHINVCVCTCVRACLRACMHVCVCVCLCGVRACVLTYNPSHFTERLFISFKLCIGTDLEAVRRWAKQELETDLCERNTVHGRSVKQTINLEAKQKQ